MNGTLDRVAYCLVELAVITVAVVFGFKECYNPPPATPTIVQARAKLDTIIVQRTIRDTITKRVDHYVTQVVKDDSTGLAHAAVEDSSAQTLVDTAPKIAYTLEKERGDSLTLRLTSTLTALDSVTADRDRWKSFQDTTQRALVSVEHDFEVATKPCKLILGRWITCPSRKATAVGGVVIGAVAGAYADSWARKH